jgi:hypothetical protein
MKKCISLIVLVALVTLNSAFGQGHKSAIASFNGNRASFDKELETKTISFTLKDLDIHSRTDFENKSKTYSSFFTIYYPYVRENKSSQVYVLTLIGKTEIKMLNRLFVSANIKQVEFEGATMSREDFFQPYMNNQ